jgi:hypothetical protein
LEIQEKIEQRDAEILMSNSYQAIAKHEEDTFKSTISNLEIELEFEKGKNVGVI